MTATITGEEHGRVLLARLDSPPHGLLADGLAAFTLGAGSGLDAGQAEGAMGVRTSGSP